MEYAVDCWLWTIDQTTLAGVFGLFFLVYLIIKFHPFDLEETKKDIEEEATIDVDERIEPE